MLSKTFYHRFRREAEAITKKRPAGTCRPFPWLFGVVVRCIDVVAAEELMVVDWVVDWVVLAVEAVVAWGVVVWQHTSAGRRATSARAQIQSAITLFMVPV